MQSIIIQLLQNYMFENKHKNSAERKSLRDKLHTLYNEFEKTLSEKQLLLFDELIEPFQNGRSIRHGNVSDRFFKIDTGLVSLLLLVPKEVPPLVFTNGGTSFLTLIYCLSTSPKRLSARADGFPLRRRSRSRAPRIPLR